MLSVGLRRPPPLTQHATRFATPRFRQRRTFFSSTIQTLSDQFLDLAVALPYPPSLPAYSTTIILVTVASRLILTVPFSVWVGYYVLRFSLKPVELKGQAKKAQWKAEDEVLPQMGSLAPRIAQEVRKKMAREGVTGTKEELNAIYSKRLNESVSADACVGYLADNTLDARGAEKIVGKTRGVANVDYGSARADTIARICAFFAGVRPVGPTSFCPGLRDVPNPNLVG